MIIVDAPQGSLDWMMERFWRLTASSMAKNITSAGKLSQSQAALASIDKLIAGLELVNKLRTAPEIAADLDDYQFQKFVSTYTGEKFAGNKFTERGKELEPDAIAALSHLIGKPVTDAGICVMGDDPNGVVSCSPDGLIYEAGALVSGVELKCPSLCTYLGYVVDDTLPDEYALQVHSSMVICGVSNWHFSAYFPGYPLFYKYVVRDRLTETLEASLSAFREQYRDRYKSVMGAISKLTHPSLTC